MGAEQAVREKSWYRISIGISLSYFGQFMLAAFIGQRLFIRWHHAPPGTSPPAHVYASTDFLMASLLILVFIATTVAFRHVLPKGIWNAVTHYSKHQSPRKLFVGTMWLGPYIAVLIAWSAFILRRTVPDQALAFTAAVATLLVLMWTIQARKAYKMWKKGPDESQGATE